MYVNGSVTGKVGLTNSDHTINREKLEELKFKYRKLATTKIMTQKNLQQLKL